MGKTLHTYARTAQAIQRPQERRRKLASKCGINWEKVAKWKKCDDMHHPPIGSPHSSTTLILEQEAAIVAFCKPMLLFLGVCLDSLQDTISALTRANLAYCLLGHGISRLSETNKTHKWEKESERLTTNPNHFTVELDTCVVAIK